MSPQTVFIVDDDPTILCLTSRILESAGLAVETFGTAEAFLDAYHPDRRGCLVLDVKMPGMGGLKLQERLAELHTQIPIIILTGSADVPTAVTVMKGGAIDLVEKPFEPEDLLTKVVKALHINAVHWAGQERRADLDDRKSHLSAREREVMDLVVDGRANKQIAAHLGISEKTVEVHRSRVMQKMRAGSVAELVRMNVAA
jgi:FixJ family two-component response regulator